MMIKGVFFMFKIDKKSMFHKFINASIILFSIIISHSSIFGEADYKIYGYFDMEADISNKPGSKKYLSFDQHHFNIISIYNIEKQFRLFAEVEYEHGPSLKDGEMYGKIYLAKSFLEYKKNDFFRLRIGKFLTPFGIYNEIHDAAPAYLYTVLPFSVYGAHTINSGYKDRLFSKFSTGLQVLGSFYYNRINVEYKLYVSNGRGSHPSENDNNANKAFGGRLNLITLNHTVHFGLSYYAEKNGLDFDRRFKILGADIEMDMGNIFWEAEAIFSQVEKLDVNNNPMNEFHYGSCFYSTLAYTFLDKYTPFIRYEHKDHSIYGEHKEHIMTIGLNVSITPKIYFKSEVHLRNLYDSTDDNYESFVSSIAVAF